jgi:hypothetical protein
LCSVQPSGAQRNQHIVITKFLLPVCWTNN